MLKYVKYKLLFRFLTFVLALFLLFFSFIENDLKDLEARNGNKIFILDVTNSMNVKDVFYNGHLVSRLELGKKIIENAIKNYPDKYGLILIADKIDYFIPPTYDKDIFLTYLKTINTNNLNGGKINFIKGMEEINNLTNYQDKLILISDFDFKINNKFKFNNNIYLVGIGTDKKGLVKNKYGKTIVVNGLFLKSSFGFETFNFLKKFLNANSFIYKEFSPGYKMVFLDSGKYKNKSKSNIDIISVIGSVLLLLSI